MSGKGSNELIDKCTGTCDASCSLKTTEGLSKVDSKQKWKCDMCEATTPITQESLVCILATFKKDIFEEFADLRKSVRYLSESVKTSNKLMIAVKEELKSTSKETKVLTVAQHRNSDLVKELRIGIRELGEDLRSKNFKICVFPETTNENDVIAVLDNEEKREIWINRNTNVTAKEMSFLDILKKKRDGKTLTKNEVYSFVTKIAKGEVHDAQIGAMLMAIYIRDLNDEETLHFTSAIVETGDVLRWQHEYSDLLVDKHSTGGVGDKISIVLTPVLAACGLKVPMLTGRGLGFSGGTLDKLESIPGFNSQCSVETLRHSLKTVGCFMAGATLRICPVDKILYSMRDVTNTVDNINLIVASIISKKVASGAKRLIIDVKVGEASFCKDLKTGKALAEKLISVSAMLGVVTKVVLSRMDSPLGWAVGNALEIEESIECLRGKGCENMMALVYTLGSNLLLMADSVRDLRAGELKMKEAIHNGSALKCFNAMIRAQGVDHSVADRLCYKDPKLVLPQADRVTYFKLKESGYIKHIDGLKIAQACWELGAGRKVATDSIDCRVGTRLMCNYGERVVEGDIWLHLYHSEHLAASVSDMLKSAVTIQDDYKPHDKLVIEVMS